MRSPPGLPRRAGGRARAPVGSLMMGRPGPPGKAIRPRCESRGESMLGRRAEGPTPGRRGELEGGDAWVRGRVGGLAMPGLRGHTKAATPELRWRAGRRDLGSGATPRSTSRDGLNCRARQRPAGPAQGAKSGSAWRDWPSKRSCILQDRISPQVHHPPRSIGSPPEAQLHLATLQHRLNSRSPAAPCRTGSGRPPARTPTRRPGQAPPS